MTGEVTEVYDRIVTRPSSALEIGIRGAISLGGVVNERTASGTH
jgi:hypothetical protein